MTQDGPLVAGAYVTIKGTRIASKLKTGGDWRGKEFGAGYYILFANETAETDAAILASLTKRNALSDLMALATRVIKSQAGRDQTVGGPIDIATIDLTGTHWQRCKAECGQGCPS